MIDQSTTSQQPTALLRQAVSAIKANDKTSARQYAQAALQQNPYIELAWLILASVSPIPAARAYLEKALSLLPHSEHLKTEYERLESKPIPEKTEENVNDASKFTADVRSNVSALDKDHQEQADHQPVPTASLEEKARKKPKLIFQLLVFCSVLPIIFFTARALKPTLVSAFASEISIVNRPANAYAKPTLTPTAIHTNTVTPTATPTLTNTPTLEPTPTITPTLEPTNTKSVEELSAEQEIYFEDHWIDIDLSDQMLHAYEDDVLINSFLVSTGTVYTPTVIGQFYVYVKYEAADMYGPGYYLPAVPWVMYFYKDYGIHAATWHNNFGTPVSHGCINMRLEDAEWVFNWTSVGTLVYIHD